MNFNIFAVFFLLLGAAGVMADDRKPQGPLETRTLELRMPEGAGVFIRAELARTPQERARGLMFRTALDGGMLFIFERDERLSFWMKNTTIPLSIAFIDRSGRITDIADMEPLSLLPVRSSRSARYALEAPRGWFARQGLSEGGLLSLDALTVPK